MFWSEAKIKCENTKTLRKIIVMFCDLSDVFSKDYFSEVLNPRRSAPFREKQSDIWKSRSR